MPAIITGHGSDVEGLVETEVATHLPAAVSEAVADAVPAAVQTAVQSAVPPAVAEAVEAHTPGMELGYASRTSTFTTTNITPGNIAGQIPGLSITLVGQGRPIDLRFTAGGVWHSVANAAVSVFISQSVPAGVLTNNILGATRSTLTNSGPSLEISRRTAPLTVGVTYTFIVVVSGAVAGTSSMFGATYSPIEFVATSR